MLHTAERLVATIGNEQIAVLIIIRHQVVTVRSVRFTPSDAAPGKLSGLETGSRRFGEDKIPRVPMGMKSRFLAFHTVAWQLNRLSQMSPSEYLQK